MALAVAKVIEMHSVRFSNIWQNVVFYVQKQSIVDGSACPSQVQAACVYAEFRQWPAQGAAEKSKSSWCSERMAHARELHVMALVQSHAPFASTSNPAWKTFFKDPCTVAINNSAHPYHRDSVLLQRVCLTMSFPSYPGSSSRKSWRIMRLLTPSR